MNKKYITVLDFEISRVFQYKVSPEKDTTEEETYNYVDFLINKGHNLSNCEWMEHEEPRVIDKNHEAYR